MVRNRNLWVVPVAVAVGWELMLDDRVVVVREVKKRDDVDVIVVVDASGQTEEIEVLREDDDVNAEALQGTALPEDDTTTPGTEAEEEVEIEEWVEE